MLINITYNKERYKNNPLHLRTVKRKRKRDRKKEKKNYFPLLFLLSFSPLPPFNSPVFFLLPPPFHFFLSRSKTSLVNKCHFCLSLSRKDSSLVTPRQLCHSLPWHSMALRCSRQLLHFAPKPLFSSFFLFSLIDISFHFLIIFYLFIYFLWVLLIAFGFCVCFLSMYICFI